MGTKVTPTTITAGHGTTNDLNTNFDTVADEFDNTLSLDGTTPNSMAADFDMNSNDILNANIINTTALKVGGTSIVPSSTFSATASNIGNVPAGDIVATDVQAAINELDSDKINPYSTISALRAITSSPTPDYAILKGYNSDGDGGGGDFYWDTSSTETDDNGTIIKATTITTGRWKRIYSGAINARWFGASPSASTSVNKTAIQAAIDLLPNGGGVHIPAGYYDVEPGISIGDVNVTLSGESDAKVYGLAAHAFTGTRLLFNSATADFAITASAASAVLTVTATAGTLEIGQLLTGSGVSSSLRITSFITGTGGTGTYGLTRSVTISSQSMTVKRAGIFIGGINNMPSLKDLTLFGNGNGTNGVIINASATLESVDVSGFTGIGFWLATGINSTIVDGCSGTGNGFGMRVADDIQSGNTIFGVKDSVFRGNNVGVRIDQALNYRFQGCVIESNTTDGVVVYQYTGLVNAHGIFENCWLENNNAGTSNYQLVIDGQSTSPQHITFNTCVIQANTGSVRAVSVVRGSQVDFYKCQFSSIATPNDIVLGTNALNCSFVQRNGGGLTDNGSFNYTVENGNNGGPTFSKSVGVGGANPSGTAAGIAFPASPVLSTNANFLDDYKEDTWTGTLTSSTGTINANDTSGTYTKIGRQVTVIGKFSAASVSTPGGNLTIAGLPYTPTAGSSFQCGVAISAENLAAGATTMIQANIQSDTNIYIWKFAAGASSALAGDVQAGTTFRIQATYFTDS